MIDSPIHLTESQKKEVYDIKVKMFKEEIEKVEAKTGMKVAAALDFSPHGIRPVLVIVPKEKDDAIQK